MEVEVFMRVDMFCPLSLGIERKDRWELASLYTLEGGFVATCVSDLG